MNTRVLLRSGATLVSLLAPAAMAVTWTVVDTVDDLPPAPPTVGSLRWAINQANADNKPPVVVDFAVPNGLLMPPVSGGVAVIQPQTPLPIIQNVWGHGITIDGFTQGGAGVTPGQPSSLVIKVELDGKLLPAVGSAPPYRHGLHIMSSGNKVQGLCVHSFPHDGICIQGIWPGTAGHPGSNANYIQWNLVGTDVGGTVALPNGHDTGWPGSLWGGIYVKVLPGEPGIANDNTILENISSGNAVEGIGIANCPDQGSEVKRNHVERNHVGTDIKGLAPLGNGHTGVYIGEGAQDNVVEQNWIAANGFEGVSVVGLDKPEIYSDGNEISRNRIGLDVGMNPMGNLLHGVAIGSYGDPSVGHHYAGGHARQTLVRDNDIAWNNMTGVVVQEGGGSAGNASGNTLTQNRIHHNGTIDPGYLGIDLAFEPGVTANDPGDPDAGPNELVNFPVIASALYAGGTTTVTGTIDTVPLPVTIELFDAVPDATGTNQGQGAVHLGSVTATTSNWSTAVAGAPVGQWLTATATDALGNTSEFSLNVVVTEAPPPEYDFGDAPDPGYPTLLANNGARHLISALFLGAAIDSEPDGQPTPGADGDDLAGDDEDGIYIPTALVPGVPTTLQVTTSGPGFVQAWIDWNADGDWSDPGENVVTDFTAPGPGTHLINFPVPNSAGAPTFARVRFSSIQGLGVTGLAPDGEVEDYPVDFEKLKWLQVPEQGAEGVDVSNVDFSLGDDFQCTETGEVTDIHLWGSFLEDVLPPEGPEGLTFRLQIWSDVPAGADPNVKFSHPGELLWEETFEPKGYQAGPVWQVKEGEWWHEPSTGVWTPAADRGIYQFDFYPRDPFRQIEGTIYWLVVKYAYEGAGQFRFGWKTTPDGWNDDAVFLDPDFGPVFWQEMIYREPHPWAPDSLNLAFALSGEPGEALDYGDAPDGHAVPGYPTLLANNGARHLIVPTVRLGAMIDGEPDGQPDSTATGDDLLDGSDDEDGVVFTTALIPGVAAAVQVAPSVPGFLNLWIDFDGNGDWVGPGEWVFNNQPVAAGPVNLGFFTQAAGYSGPSFARVRFTSQPLPAGVDHRGLAPDGEVEDLMVMIEEEAKLDFGDAPDGPYPTLIVRDGARHVTNPAMRLGARIDAEPDGQPDSTATGDDLNGSSDEDGVFWYPMVSGAMSAIDVTATMPGKVDVWIDLNGNGSWLDPGEKVLSMAPVLAGKTQLPFVVPPGIPHLKTFARVRYSSAGVAMPTGMAADGEVEDYHVRIDDEGDWAFDFGDAPDPSYPTLAAASGGAAHVMAPPFLGALTDPEPDGQPSPNADGDDIAAIDDEDGVTFGYALIGGKPSVVEIIASATGAVDMWVDWNANGTWLDPGEQVLMAQPVNPGPNYITLSVPFVGSGPTMARVRISSLGGLPPTGFAVDGEVEDYKVELYEEGAMDFGDAPESGTGFQTTMMNFGAAHFIDSLFMGYLVDGEFDGQPSSLALGDDFMGVPDDEDGVSFDTVWIEGIGAQITVTLPGGAPSADLEAWADWDGDGTWTQAGEHVIVNAPMVPGPNVLTVPVPTGSGPAWTFARFRLFHAGTSVGYTGFAQGGEVEDYTVPIGKAIRAGISIDRSVTPNKVVLNWSSEPGATTYTVYSSTTLAGAFPGSWTLEASGLTSLTWKQNLVAPRKFYVVVAFP